MLQQATQNQEELSVNNISASQHSKTKQKHSGDTVSELSANDRISHTIETHMEGLETNVHTMGSYLASNQSMLTSIFPQGW